MFWIKNSFGFSICHPIWWIPYEPKLLDLLELFVFVDSAAHEVLHFLYGRSWDSDAVARPTDTGHLKRMFVKIKFNHFLQQNFIVECWYLQENTFCLRRLNFDFQIVILNLVLVFGDTNTMFDKVFNWLDFGEIARRFNQFDNQIISWCYLN